MELSSAEMAVVIAIAGGVCWGERLAEKRRSRERDNILQGLYGCNCDEDGHFWYLDPDGVLMYDAPEEE